MILPISNLAVDAQCNRDERANAIRTFVSGFEAFDVAGSIILVHLHLLSQRLGSHAVYDAVANLRRAKHESVNAVSSGYVGM